jgi:hypothetical protein
MAKQIKKFQETHLSECTTVLRQPDSRVDMAGPGVVSMVSDMGQSPQGVLKKRNLPNARQRQHHPEARSPVEDMTFCAPHRVVTYVESLQ